ncbi:sigma-70 family RNA polymerase sigma factor [Sphingobacterium sp. N143]|uniref:RNA polymerase sigma factor n=1 Tax=Sphingobacterium sp. N143 TaxID=2746727 RepID=UPI002575BBBF|nr:sigma-70 family RNA polymerase sigma factor [Sphingobacterium sp. N143]MDM1296297.1 sigma-70 family RNA polymerase sigma factor [Sphingobacterium sp. N143]
MDIGKDFITLITSNQAIIHRICCMYVENKADREDLFQEIILQAWKSFKSFRDDAKFQTWLYRVGLNTAITYIKRDHRHSLAELQFSQEGYCEMTYHEDEEVYVMYQAISKLSNVEKALVTLYLEDYSYNEIAETMGMTPNHVAVKISRIKTKLKKLSKGISSWN